MGKFTCYMNCKNYVSEVKEFLAQFFEEEKGRYSHSEWVTFKIPKTNFVVNLMSGDDQLITQNMTFEIECESMKELENYAKKYDKKILDFLATKVEKEYRFYYFEIPGPQNICKIDISFSEDLD